jgi:hypothetical protein
MNPNASTEHVRATFHLVLVSDTPDSEGRGGLPAEWACWGEPIRSPDAAQSAFSAAVAGCGRPVVALAEVDFTDVPSLGHRAVRVARVAAWHGPLGLVPGISPGGRCWDSMEAVAFDVIVRHLGTRST